MFLEVVNFSKIYEKIQEAKTLQAYILETETKLTQASAQLVSAGIKTSNIKKIVQDIDVSGKPINQIFFKNTNGVLSFSLVQINQAFDQQMRTILGPLLGRSITVAAIDKPKRNQIALISKEVAKYGMKSSDFNNLLKKIFILTSPQEYVVYTSDGYIVSFDAEETPVGGGGGNGGDSGSGGGGTVVSPPRIGFIIEEAQDSRMSFFEVSNGGVFGGTDGIGSNPYIAITTPFSNSESPFVRMRFSVTDTPESWGPAQGYVGSRFSYSKNVGVEYMYYSGEGYNPASSPVGVMDLIPDEELSDIGVIGVPQGQTLHVGAIRSSDGIIPGVYNIKVEYINRNQAELGNYTPYYEKNFYFTISNSSDGNGYGQYDQYSQYDADSSNQGVYFRGFWFVPNDSSKPNWILAGERLQSAPITDDGDSETKTIFNAPAGMKLRFDWGVDSESTYDSLDIWLDEQLIVGDGNPNGLESGSNQGTYTTPSELSVGSHTLVLKYRKDQSVASGQDAAWLTDISLIPVEGGNDGSGGDNTQVTFRGFVFVPNDSSKLNWILSGERLQSAPIPHNGASETKTTFDVPAGMKLRFDWGVNSESTYDSLDIWLDEQLVVGDGLPNGLESGFRQGTYTTPSELSVGSHTLVLKYRKDEIESDGQDAAWLTDISLIPAGDGSGGDGSGGSTEPSLQWYQEPVSGISTNIGVDSVLRSGSNVPVGEISSHEFVINNSLESHYRQETLRIVYTLRGSGSFKIYRNDILLWDLPSEASPELPLGEEYPYKIIPAEYQEGEPGAYYWVTGSVASKSVIGPAPTVDRDDNPIFDPENPNSTIQSNDLFGNVSNIGLMRGENVIRFEFTPSQPNSSVRIIDTQYRPYLY